MGGRRRSININDKYGDWLVLDCYTRPRISSSGNNYFQSLVKALCTKCNTVWIDVQPSALRNGRSKSCRICGPKRLIKTKEQQDFQYDSDFISGIFWNQIKTSAKVRGLKLEVTKSDLQDLARRQNFKCALTGLPILFLKSHWKRKKLLTSEELRRLASLDRIDSGKGYVTGNLQWVAKIVNLMKLNTNQKEFIEICKLISTHHDSQQSTPQ